MDFFFVVSFYILIAKIDFIFSIKPFMIMSAAFLIAMVYAKKTKFIFSIYDKILILFFIYAGFLSILVRILVIALGFLLGGFIILFCYSIMKMYLINYNFTIDCILNIYYRSWFVFILISLAMYIVGIIIINGDFDSYNNSRVYGVMVERMMPRLIGLQRDPNIFAFMSIPILFYLFFMDKKKLFDYFYMCLVFVSILLTISTAAILSLGFVFLCVFFVYIINLTRNFKLKNKGVFVYLLFSSLLIFGFVFLSNSDFVIEILYKRINNLSVGSGRFEIWNNLIDIWCDNYFFGIGLNNFIRYNVDYFGRYNYAHNTFLEVLVETGVFGLLAYCVFHLCLLVRIYRISSYSNKFVFFIYSYIGMLIMLNSLSLLINEGFFCFLSLFSCIEYKLKKHFNL